MTENPYKAPDAVVGEPAGVGSKRGLRARAVRLVAMLLGVLFLVGGVSSIASGFAGSVPLREVLGGVGMLVFSWIMMSHGMGWHGPLRRRAPASTEPPSA